MSTLSFCSFFRRQVTISGLSILQIEPFHPSLVKRRHEKQIKFFQMLLSVILSIACEDIQFLKEVLGFFFTLMEEFVLELHFLPGAGQKEI